MYCSQCGQQQPEDARFCSGCGSQLAQAMAWAAPAVPAQQELPSPLPQKSPNKKILIGLAAASLLAVVGLVVSLALGLSGGGQRSYQWVVKEYFKAVEQADGKKLFDLSINRLSEQLGFLDASKRLEFIYDFEEEVRDDWGSRIETSYTIDETESLPLSDLLDLLDVESLGLNITELMLVTVSYTVRGSEDSDYDTDDFTLLKANGRWYIFDCPIWYI